MHLPIRIKILLSVLLLLMLAVAVIVGTMARLFHADKTIYVKDLAAVTATGTQFEVDTLLGRYAGAAFNLGEVISADYLSAEQKERMAAGIFTANPSLLAVSAQGPAGAPITLFEGGALRELGLASEQLAITDLAAWPQAKAKSLITRIAPLDVGKERLLRVGIVGETPTGLRLLVATLRADAITAALKRVTTFQTFWIGGDGVALLANDPTLVNAYGRGNAQASSLPGSTTVQEQRIDGHMYFVGRAPSNSAPSEILVRIPREAAYLTAQDLVRQLVWVGAGLVLFAALIGIFMARRLSRPLEKLSAAAKVVGEGRFDVSVGVEGRDEVGALARSFNSMAQNLQERDARLKEANDALVQSEKMAALGQLSAGLAHEVKNPLAGILGFAQLSRRKLDDPVVLKENLDVIERETRRCTEIIGNLMRFSRRETLDRAPTDLNDVVAHAVVLVDHQLSLKNVEIETHTADELPFVFGSSNQLQQILMNLLINAQQAMEPKGGTVQIRTELDEGERFVVLEVEDSGPGVPEAIRSKIFDPFFTTKPAGQGTGLGLSVTFGIVTDHGGTIAVVDSRSGRGACFRMRLPARPDLGRSGGSADGERSEAA